jgi:anti-sigma-K factor RskA
MMAAIIRPIVPHSRGPILTLPIDPSPTMRPADRTADRPSDHIVELLRRVADGDRKAFASLYTATSAKLYGIIVRILIRRDLSDEILQDVYLKIWQMAGDYDVAKGSPITWMAAIARNRAIDEVRRVKPVSIEDSPEALEYASRDPDVRHTADETGYATLAEMYRCPGTGAPRYGDARLFSGREPRGAGGKILKAGGHDQDVAAPLRCSTQGLRRIMTDVDDIDVLAAEYVLGSLDASERAQVAARRQREPALEAAILAWEQRLAPLNELTPPVVPPDRVWAGIEARLNQGAGSASRLADGGNVIALQRRLTAWRRIAVAASALAASLVVTIGLRETTRTTTPRSFVAVFQKDDALPSFLLSIDLESRQLTIKPVSADTPTGKSYQLWIAAAPIGEPPATKPRSLGVLEGRGLTTKAALSAYDKAVVETATFGVSLEPAGGSPTGQPTGPVFHAKLIPAT